MNWIKKNYKYFVIAIVVVIVSFFTIKGSGAGSLSYSFPAADVDFSGISWTEVSISDGGESFGLKYDAWDIGQVGLRVNYDVADAGSGFSFTIEDGDGEAFSKSYVISNLAVDSEGMTWFDVGCKVKAGDLKITIGNEGTEGLRVIGYYQDGVFDESGNARCILNMKVNAAQYPKSRGYVFAGVWMVLAVVLLLVVKGRRVPVEVLFACVYLFMGIMAFVVFPPFAEPDAGNHYRRAYAISEGVLMPTLDEENGIGGMFAWPESWASGDNTRVTWYEVSGRRGFDVTDAENMRYLRYTNIALYSPICHVVPAIGMKIARVFTHDMMAIAMVARVFNFLAIGGLLLLGVRLMPFGKEYFLWVVTNPVFMKLYTSISPDMVTAALVFVLMAVVLRLRYDDGAAVFAGVEGNSAARRKGTGRGYLAVLFVIPFLLGQFKIVYVAFCMLLFLIPMKKFGDRKRYIGMVAAIGAVTLVPALVWLKVSSGILSAGYGGSARNTEIALNPVKYVPVLLNTLVQQGYDYFQQMFGSTIGFSEAVNQTVVVGYMVFALVLLGVLRARRKRMDGAAGGSGKDGCGSGKAKADIALNVVTVAAMVITAVLIFTAEYVQWTEAGSSIVDGIQGRYFFPFIVPVLVLWGGRREVCVKNGADAGQGGKCGDGEAAECGVDYDVLFGFVAFAVCFMAQLFVQYRV